jgi:antirestriction protein ArdC
MDDTIGLPNDSAFTCEHERESTKAHEGIHATGAKRRLNRKAFREYSVENYAYEELVAELGAAMTCQYLGIPLE